MQGGDFEKSEPLVRPFTSLEQLLSETSSASNKMHYDNSPENRVHFNSRFHDL
jgi:hypothetical protein